MKKYTVIEKGTLSDEYIVHEFETLDGAYTFFMADRINRVIYRQIVVSLLGEPTK